MSKRKSQAGHLADAKLERTSAPFDRPNYSPRFGKAPAREQRRHDTALRRAKRRRGRPPLGSPAQRIQVTVERRLLAEADGLARRERISRSELIARGLRLALAS